MASDAYSELCQISTIKHFTKIVSIPHHSLDKFQKLVDSFDTIMTRHGII